MTTQLSPLPVQKFFDNNGVPLVGGLLYTYGAGTSTPQPTYTDSTGITANTNPIILNSRGEAQVWLTPGQAYKFQLQDSQFNTIWTVDNIYSGLTSDFFTSLGSTTDSTKGAALIGYLPPWSGAVGQTVSQRLQEYVSAQEFGLKTTNTGAQNNTAIALAIAYATSVGGATIHIPRGTYNFATTISLTGNSVRLTGDGIDATILSIGSATLDFISSPGTTYYQSIDNLTLTSSVTRTAGSMFTCGFWKRGLFYRVKVSQHFNGLNFPAFEQCTLSETNIVTPSGNGAAIIAGTSAATNQGANLNIIDCFIRGNDETNPVSTAVGRYGLVIYDVQAIFCVNTDFSAVTDQIMLVNPQFACENCYFVQTFFDTTVNGDNVLVQGAGLKDRFTFNGCWFASAGRYGAGHVDCFGVNLTDNGTYADWNFTGCRFLGMSGAGIALSTPQADVNITGCNFNSCGANTVTYTSSIYFKHAVAQTKFANITGCNFIAFGPNTADILFSTANSSGNVIGSNLMQRGVSYVAGTTFGSVSGNSDPNSPTSIASAATLQVSPTKNLYFVTGTTNVGGLFRTFPGHTVTFVAITGFTWTNGGALVLAGDANFVALAGGTITLVCDITPGVWREISRHT